MLKNYIKIAFKVFLRRKFYTFISLFGISFTLTVLIIAVSVFESMVGPVAPEIYADRTLEVNSVRIFRGSNRNGAPPGYDFLDRYLRTLPLIQKASIYSLSFSQPVVYHDGKRLELILKGTDAAYWEIMRYTFIEGSRITEEDDRDANFTCIINEATRQKFFGSEPATGKYIEMKEVRYRVKGVVKNVPRFRQCAFADVWVPLSTVLDKNALKGIHGQCRGIVLAVNKAVIPEIKKEYESRLKNIDKGLLDGWDGAVGVIETTYERFTRNYFHQGFWSNDRAETYTGFIIGTILIFMLLPAVNLINLNVSRIRERSSEIGVRKTFGATTWTLLGQLIVENILFTLIGGVAGFIFSYLVLGIARDSGLIQYAEFTFNFRVFSMGILLTLVFALFSGIYPAWRMARLHPVYALRGEQI
ncbi:MAG: ABC transporter permease [Patescibacteria group bacterium]|nr:ABC transporter permease [Patescibacteria group bacterium]